MKNLSINVMLLIFYDGSFSKKKIMMGWNATPAGIPFLPSNRLTRYMNVSQIIDGGEHIKIITILNQISSYFESS